MIDTVPTAGSRWRILAFAVFLAAIGTVLGQSAHSIASAPGKISKRFQLALQINSETIKAGLSVMVIATLRNISRAKRWSGLFCCRLELIHED